MGRALQRLNEAQRLQHGISFLLAFLGRGPGLSFCQPPLGPVSEKRVHQNGGIERSDGDSLASFSSFFWSMASRLIFMGVPSLVCTPYRGWGIFSFWLADIPRVCDGGRVWSGLTPLLLRFEVAWRRDIDLLGRGEALEHSIEDRCIL